MEDKIRVVQEKLIQIARRKELTNYTEAGSWVDLDMSTDVGRILIAQILDEINSDEVSQGHPMLSALVIYKDISRPGSGFFQCARGLGRFTDDDEDGFWAKEVKAVHNWWSSH